MPSYVKIKRMEDDDYAKEQGCTQPDGSNHYAFTPGHYFKDHPCYNFSSMLNARGRRKYQEIQHYVLSKDGCKDPDALVLCVRYPHFPKEGVLVVTKHAVGECPCCTYAELKRSCL
jgi:hypothetical protein